MSKTRPLGTLSDFVVEELPQLLVDDPAVIPQEVEVRLRKLVDDNQIHKAYFENRELCLLDLKFCEVAMIRRKIEVPPILTNSVDFFSGALNIPGLQYHELVEVNPISDMRAFTTGEVGETEKMFYNSHRFVENRLSRLLLATEDYLDKEQNSTQLISGYNEFLDFDPIRSIMMQLHGMRAGHFPIFREYISSPCPVRQVDGPSGQYSWRIPYLELLFWGKDLPDEYLLNITDKLEYYSPEGRGRVSRRLKQLDEKERLLDKIEVSEDVVDVIRAWIAFMRTFRSIHLGAVKNQTPEVFEDKADGTSGNPKPGTYLKERIRNMDMLYKSFSKKYSLKS